MYNRYNDIVFKKDELYSYRGELKDKNIWIKQSLPLKTDFVYNYYGFRNVYFKDNSRFFQCYNKEKCILLIIKTKQQAKKMFSLLIRLGDCYAFCAETRKSFFKIYPKNYELVIVSSFQPSDLYSGKELKQIERRFCIVDFK